MSIQLKRGSVPVVGTNKVSEGLHFCVRVWAKSGSRDWRDRWHQTCKALGVAWEPTPDNDGTRNYPSGKNAAWETCYDCWGAPEALESLTSGVHKCVIRWEYAMQPLHAPMPTIGPEERAHTPKKKHHPKNSGAFRALDRVLAPHRAAYHKQLVAGCGGLDPNK